MCTCVAGANPIISVWKTWERGREGVTRILTKAVADPGGLCKMDDIVA